MSEAAAADKAPAPKGGGGNKMLLLIVLVVNVLIAGGLAYVVISNQKSAAAAAAAAAKHGAAEGEGEEGGEGHEAAAEGEGHAAKGGGKFGPLIEIGTFVANLTSANGQSRYAKVALHVEAVNEEAKVTLEAAVVPIRSESLLFLSGLSAEQVIGQEKIRQLQEDLQKRLTTLVGKNTVKRVYFSEFVVQ
jgi:flagellar FliL protein